MTVGVLLALGEDEAEVVRLIDAPGSGAKVVRRCADVAEVLAGIDAGVGATVVLGATLVDVDRASVAQLRQREARVLLVGPSSDMHRLAALGADDVVAQGEGAGAIASHALTLATSARPVGTVSGGAADPPGAPADPPGTVPGGPADPPGPPPGGAAEANDEGAEGGRRSRRRARRAREAPPAEPHVPAEQERGTLVVVWGTRGAPGRSTIAVNLAAEAALAGAHVLLVDADTEAPALGQILGLLEETSTVAAVARAAAHGRLDVATVERHLVQVAPGLTALTGLTRPERWRELEPAALDAVWEVARAVAPRIVVDVAAGVEAGDGSGFGPPRHGATRSALAAADVVVVVGSADPVGMRRLVLAVGALHEEELAPGAREVVVVTKVRRATTGPSPAGSVREALVRFAGVSEAHLVPMDAATADTALLAGTTWADVAPAAAARRAVADLAAEVFGLVPARRRRGRRALLAMPEPHAGDAATG